MIAFVAAMVLAHPGPGLQGVVSPGSRQTVQSFSRTVNLQVNGHFLLYFPPDYEASHHRFPLILFLHGSGERGTDLEILKNHGMPKEIASGRQFEFVVASPQCPPGQSWDIPTLEGLLDELVHKYRIDQDRIYLTGLSMGGIGTYALAAAQPHRFAAIAPIAGAADPSIAPEIQHLPIWAIHGEKDDAVKLERERPVIDALKALHADVRWEVIPEGGHDVWTPVYAGRELYTWFLQHKRAR